MNKKLFTVILILIAIIAIFVGYLTFELGRQKRRNENMARLFKIEKEEMENEYSNFALQYDELQVQINNDSLRIKLEGEKQRTQHLLEELKQVKTTSAAEIIRLKKELGTVRTILRSYIVQVDSLNRINQALTTENQEIRKQLDASTVHITTLNSEKSNLNAKIALASQLDVTGLNVIAKNNRGKAVRKTRDATKLTINFTIVKNITAKTGERTIYIRITNPGNRVLTKNAGDTFKYENKKLEYSIKKYIEYKGEELSVTAYWNIEEYLQAGTYNVSIFSGGNMIGSKSFTLQ